MSIPNSKFAVTRSFRSHSLNRTLIAFLTTASALLALGQSIKAQTEAPHFPETPRIDVTAQPVSSPTPYDDRRVKLLKLTAKGTKLRQTALERLYDPPAGFERLTPEEQRTLARLLEKAAEPAE